MRIDRLQHVIEKAVPLLRQYRCKYPTNDRTIAMIWASQDTVPLLTGGTVPHKAVLLKGIFDQSRHVRFSPTHLEYIREIWAIPPKTHREDPQIFLLSDPDCFEKLDEAIRY